MAFPRGSSIGQSAFAQRAGTLQAAPRWDDESILWDDDSIQWDAYPDGDLIQRASNDSQAGFARRT